MLDLVPHIVQHTHDIVPRLKYELELHMITVSTLMILHRLNDYTSSIKAQLFELTSESSTTTWFNMYTGCTNG